MKRIFFILTALLLINGVQAQKETNIWHFGLKAGLDFNKTQPTKACNEVSWNGSAWITTNQTINDLPISIPGYVNTMEGCFSISDSDGNLLLSSDGSTLYDKAGGTMASGLGGDNSSTQSGIVIPKPGDPDSYYIVSVNEYRYGKMYYAEVNMSLNSRKGGIISQNNAISTFNADENIAVVPNDNGVDYWLLHRYVNTYYVWKVTNSGFTLHGTTPTGSTTAHSADFVGELIVSPDGTKIAAMTYYRKQILTADFNPATGDITNTQFMAVTTTGWPYGGCFSPNSKYLYYTISGDVSYCASWTALRSGSQGSKFQQVTNIHRAADGRLYGIISGSKTLYVVEDPDNGDLKVKYINSFFTTGTPQGGLPAFLSSYFRTNLKLFPLACNQNEREISVEITSGGSSPATTIDWDFGDGSSLVTQNISSGTNIYTQTHKYTDTGSKKIIITPYDAYRVAKTPQTFEIDVIPCAIKTNRMIRTNLKDQGEP